MFEEFPDEDGTGEGEEDAEDEVDEDEEDEVEVAEELEDVELGELDIKVDSRLSFVRARLTSKLFLMVILIYAQPGTAVSAGISSGNLGIGPDKQSESKRTRIRYGRDNAGFV